MNFETKLKQLINPSVTMMDKKYCEDIRNDITKMVADTVLKAVPEKMKEAPRNINFIDQEAAVKGGWNAARDRMLISLEKELGIKEKSL